MDCNLILSRAIGCLLLAAAGLKLNGWNVAPYAQFGWLALPHVKLVAVEWEIVLGLWLLSGRFRLGSWLGALVTFIIFAAVSMYLGIIGQASCGCFGKIEASPWAACVIDLVVMTLLLSNRPDFQSLRHTEGRRTLPASFQIVGGIAVVFSSCYGLAIFLYGSSAAALARLRGEVIYIQPNHVDFGLGEPGELINSSVKATNCSDHPIRLIGGTKDCSCSVVGGLPVTIHPGDSVLLPLSLTVPRNTFGQFTHDVELWTDDDSERTIFLTLGCQIRNPGANSGHTNKED